MSNVTNVYVPLNWQVEPFRDKSSVLLLTGSAGGGKSKIAGEKLHAFMMKYPGATGIVGRKDKTAAGKSVVPFLRSNVQGNSDWGRYYSHGLFKYKNGSELWVVGLKGDDQREALKSIGKDGNVDIAWFEEANALVEDDHNLLLTRMRGTAADWTQIIYSTNPDRPNHWINQRLILGGEAAVYYSRAQDNPHNPPEYLGTLDKLTGVMRFRMRDGLWVMAEGAIYDMFDPAVHVLERSASEMKTWYLAQDEGYTNPAVILLVGEDNDGRWHIFREYYERGKLQSTVVSQSVYYCDVIRRFGDEVTLAAVDAAAAGLIAELGNNDVPAIPAKGRVLDGIQNVQDRLRVHGDGLPRLTVSPRCRNTINEFESYTWKKTTAGISKDEPNKENDHAMDAIRYLDTVASNAWIMS